MKQVKIPAKKLVTNLIPESNVQRETEDIATDYSNKPVHLQSQEGLSTT